MSSAPILSRAWLRIARGGGATERRSTAPYLIHQAIADLFGDRDDRGYLYRVTAEGAGTAEVLILSARAPLPVQALPSPPHRRAVRAQSKPFAPEFAPGQALDFEVRLNATAVVTDAGTGKKWRRDAWEAVWQREPDTLLSPHQVYRQYLARKLDGAAAVLDARVTERGEVQARRGDQRHAIRFVATNLIGTLQVHDPERLLEVVAAGVGRAKAFGCGLICLSRPGTVLARRYPERAAELL